MVLADAADVVDCSRHDENTERELSGLAFLACGVAAGSVTVCEAVDDFFDIADVLGRDFVGCFEGSALRCFDVDEKLRLLSVGEERVPDQREEAETADENDQRERQHGPRSP